MDKSEAIAALRRAAGFTGADDGEDETIAILNALADAIEQAQKACQGPDYADQISTDAVIGWSPVWIIPAPRLP